MVDFVPFSRNIKTRKPVITIQVPVPNPFSGIKQMTYVQRIRSGVIIGADLTTAEVVIDPLLHQRVPVNRYLLHAPVFFNLWC